jgi:beta-glucosidase/6-phospho-beta-glucosidase/beta-galactosidase/ABC-type amino acid transport substrate-binding protein
VTRILYGVGTSDHQCEARDPARPEWDDTWDRWEQDKHLTPRGRATDFWSRYTEDIDLAQQLGCTAFRFSTAWARVQAADGTFDEAVLSHYDAVTQAVVDAGMAPIVTLMHGAWPTHIDLTDDCFPERFAAYAGRVARQLSPRVTWWLTFNEPDLFVYGYLKPWWMGEYRTPPGLPPNAGPDEPMRHLQKLISNLFKANALARAAIQKEHPGAKVSANVFLLGLPRWLQWFLDWRLRLLRRQPAWSRNVHRTANRRLPRRGKVDLVAATLSASGERGRLVDFSRPYHAASLKLLVPSDSAVARTATTRDGAIDALRGATVGAVRGTTAVAAAVRVLRASQVRLAASHRDALADLEAGRVAAILADDVILDSLVQQARDRWVVLPCALAQERYVIAVPKGDTALLAVANEVIGDAVTGATAPGHPSSALEGGAIDRVRRRGHLVAGVRDDVAGFGSRDMATGIWSGKEVDLVHEIARRVLGGAHVQFHPIGDGDGVRALRSVGLRVLDRVVAPFDWIFCVLNGNWWHLGIKGKLPKWLCPIEARHAQDYVAVDYYYGMRNLGLLQLRQLLHAVSGEYANAPVWPPALRRTLRRLAGRFPGQDVMVVENGAVSVVSGIERAKYLRDHMRQVWLAMRDGVPVVGYLCWSITSNREWGQPFGPGSDFGLYHIDLDTDPGLARTIAGGAVEYQRLIREGSQ